MVYYIFYVHIVWYKVVVAVVVFFTLTDRASTIPSNIRGCQSGTWSQRGTKVNGSHHGDNPLLRPTGIQIATKSYATLQAMAPTNNKTVHETFFTPYREQPRSTRIRKGSAWMHRVNLRVSCTASRFYLFIFYFRNRLFFRCVWCVFSMTATARSFARVRFSPGPPREHKTKRISRDSWSARCPRGAWAKGRAA